MQKIRSTDAKQNFGEFMEMPQDGPVTITIHGREKNVLLSMGDYHRLRKVESEYLEMELKTSIEQARAGQIVSIETAYQKGLAVFDED
jgi:prevent-host-death family protein